MHNKILHLIEFLGNRLDRVSSSELHDCCKYALRLQTLITNRSLIDILLQENLTPEDRLKLEEIKKAINERIDEQSPYKTDKT